MKKIWLAVLAVITILLSVYAIYAGITVNGIEIYFVSYEAGRLFSATYVIAGLLAVIGWIVLIVSVIKLVRPWWNSEEKSASQKVIPEEFKCAGCGASLAADAKFCTQCGKKVE